MSEKPGHTTSKGILSGKTVCWHLQWRMKKDDIMQVVFRRRKDLPLYYVRSETSFQAEWYREGGRCMMMEGEVIKGEAYDELWMRNWYSDNAADELIEEEGKGDGAS